MKLCSHATFKTMTGHFVKFEQCFGSKSNHFTGNLGANMIEHVSEMKLYIILSTLILNVGIREF